MSLAGAIVRHFEGCALNPYKDAAGYWTIGWGHKMADDEPKVGITQAQADQLLELDLKTAGDAVEAAVPSATDGQRAALTSFDFNLGAGALAQLLGHPDVEAQFDRWIYVHRNGIALTEPGLVKRRAVEAFVYSLPSLEG